jgi:hypothetical protein
MVLSRYFYAGGLVRITCGSCDFSVQTHGESFRYTEDNVRFCLSCGKSYSETGVNVGRIYKAVEARVSCQQRIAFWTGLLPVLIYMITALIVILRNPGLITAENLVVFVFVMCVLPLAYMFWILTLASSRGSKRYYEVMGN